MSRRLKSGLVIPTSVTSVKPPAFVCRVIVDKDRNLCGKQFHADEPRAYQSHVIACAKQHESEIRAASLRERMPGFFGLDAADREAEEWVRKNRREIIEGRKSFVGKRRRHEVRKRR